VPGFSPIPKALKTVTARKELHLLTVIEERGGEIVHAKVHLREHAMNLQGQSEL
jgi:hypothetical protein